MVYSKRSGFTLIEMLVVLGLIGALMAIVGPMIMTRMEKAKVRTAKLDLRRIRQGIEMFYRDTKVYPRTLRDLIKRPSDLKIAQKWESPYIKDKDKPKDPWNAHYRYSPAKDGPNAYTLFSYGSKGRKASKLEQISVWSID